MKENTNFSIMKVLNNSILGTIVKLEWNFLCVCFWLAEREKSKPVKWFLNEKIKFDVKSFCKVI